MLKQLSLLNGTSGFEETVSEVLTEKMKACCDKVFRDNIGNLYAFKKGTDLGQTVALFAHTDEVALIISSITPEGLLKFRTVGGIDESVLVGKRVTVGPSGIPGVIGARAVHLMSDAQKKEKLPLEKLYIDIGAVSAEQAETVVKKGDVAYFEGFWHETKTHIFGKAFDDRAGCAILAELAKNTYAHDIWFVFTTQEEVGTRGATVASRRIDADVYIVVENTTCLDMPDVEKEKRSTNCGDGPAITIADGASFANLEVRSRLAQTDIPHQFKNVTAGGNDARAIASNGKKVAAVSCPCRYLHAQVGVIAKEDFKNTVNLLDAYLKGESLC